MIRWEGGGGVKFSPMDTPHLKELRVLYPYRSKWTNGRNLRTEQADHKYLAILCSTLLCGLLRPLICNGRHTSSLVNDFCAENFHTFAMFFFFIYKHFQMLLPLILLYFIFFIYINLLPNLYVYAHTEVDAIYASMAACICEVER